MSNLSGNANVDLSSRNTRSFDHNLYNISAPSQMDELVFQKITYLTLNLVIGSLVDTTVLQENLHTG